MPLRSIAPGLDSGVLTVLAGTESALSASAIARLAGYGTRNGQRPVLNRLVRDGLVLAEPGNQGNLYRFNRRHLLASAVLAATQARSELVSRLRAALSRLEPELAHASIFGSFARGDADADSDIDLLLIASSGVPEIWSDRLLDLADDVRAWTGNLLQPLSMSTADVNRMRGDEPIVDDWLREGITLVGPDLSELLSVAGLGR